MASLKLMAAIMVALFAIGLEAGAIKSPYETEREPTSVGGIGPAELCLKVISEMKKLTPNGEADAEKTFALATSVFDKFDFSWGYAGRKLKAALATVVHRSNCNESSSAIIQTIAYCNLWEWNSTKSLDDAAREYAQECYKPEYIKDMVSSALNNSNSLEVAELIDHQFFVDYRSEFQEDKQMSNRTVNEEKFAKALAKAIIRDSKENITKLEKEGDVYEYLEKRLFKPCSTFRSAVRKVLSPFYGMLIFYLGGYEKVVSSLDETTQEQFSRQLFCSNLHSVTSKTFMSRKVLSHLQSTSDE